MQKVADTSIAANKKSKPNRRSQYLKIIEALKQLKDCKGNAHLISTKCTLSDVMVNRRLKEMVGLNMIIKTTETMPTGNDGFVGFVHQLLDKDKPQEKKETQIIELKPGQLKLAL